MRDPVFKKLFYAMIALFVVCAAVGFVYAADQYAVGNFSGRGIYTLYNFSNVTANSYVVGTTGVCIGSDCRTSWPTGAITTIQSGDTYLTVANGSITNITANLTTFDARYVNVAGDSMTGQLAISTADATGALVVGGGGDTKITGDAIVQDVESGWTKRAQFNIVDSGGNAGLALIRSNSSYTTIQTPGGTPTATIILVQATAVGGYYNGAVSGSTITAGDAFFGSNRNLPAVLFDSDQNAVCINCNTTTANLTVTGNASISGQIRQNSGLLVLDTASTFGGDVTGTNTSIQIAANAVGSPEIAADAVDSSEIATNAVGTAEIATDAVDSAEIAANAVGSSEIATDAVDSAEIAANAVGSSELASSGVSANTYGSASSVPVFVVDVDGRITSVTNTAISISGGAINDWPGACPTGTAMVAINGTGGVTTIYCDPINNITGSFTSGLVTYATNSSNIATDAGLAYDAATNALTVDGRITLDQGEFLNNTVDGKIGLYDNSAGSNGTFVIDWASNPFFVGLSGCGTNNNCVIKFDGHFAVGDNILQIFGDGTDAVGTWETTGNDNLQWAIGVGSAAQSGYVTLVEYNDQGVANRSPSGTSANPVFRVYSADASVSTDYIEILHDQTNGVINLGNGELVLNPGLNAASIDRILQTGTGTQQFYMNGTDAGGGVIQFFINRPLTSGWATYALGTAGTEKWSLGMMGSLALDDFVIWDSDNGNAQALRIDNTTDDVSIPTGDFYANDDAFVDSGTSGSNSAVGGVFDDIIGTGTGGQVNNSGTSETTLMSKTLPAAYLATSDGDKVTYYIAGSLVDATSTARFRVYLQGSSVCDTGALTLATTGDYWLEGTIIRDTSTSIKSICRITTAATTAGSFTDYTTVTGLSSLTSTASLLNITGTAGGGTGGSNDIVFEYGSIGFQPAGTS